MKAQNHSLFEDIQGIFTGVIFVALGVFFIKNSGLMTGGATGIGVLLNYAFSWHLGLTIFIINLPFYILGWREIGKIFIFKTFIAVGLLSLFISVMPTLIEIKSINIIFCAVISGLLLGVGILVLIRHNASLGGVGIVAIYLQKKYNFSAGLAQMLIDVVILITSILIISFDKVLYSLMGALSLNLVIWVNHRNGRYFGT